MEEGTVRLRVEFDDHLLTESQKSEGFVRCWLLVRPDFTTVSDVAAHILRTFALDGTCPDGIILSMDDFVLPLFESTSIFKNSDKVRVSKKLDKKKKLFEIGGEAYHIQNSDIVEKRPIFLCDELLTVQDSQEDIRLFIAIPCKNKTVENAYAEEERTTNMPTFSIEEINLKRKRKQSDELQNPKKKKCKLHSLKQTSTTANLKDNIHSAQHKSLTLAEACISSSEEETFSKLITSHSDDDHKDCSTTKGKRKKKCKLHRLKQTSTTADLKDNIHSEQHKSLTLEEACTRSSGEEKLSKLITSHSDDDHKDCSTTKGKRKKKLKLYNSKKTSITVNQEENIHAEQQKSLALDETLSLSNGNEIFYKTTSQNDDQNDCSIATQERSDYVDNFHKIPPELHTGDTKKLPSRSARRKKAKRLWRRQAEQKVEVQVLTNDKQNTSSDYQAVDETSDREEEIIPVIVRPGHIRFESLDDQEHKNTHSNGPVETLKWNGTTSKKKGQKWGREKTIGWNDDQYTSRTSSDNIITDKEQHADDQTNFESLFPLTRLPKEGDVLVYRLVELSSSWCPEISPFRVGKVSSYDPISENIVLVLVPEYPILKKDKDAEESPLQADSTLYTDDGSLEIKYTSLLDVRLFKEQCPNSLQNEKSEVGRSINLAVETNSKQSATPLSDAGLSTGWEQIELALDEKKSQLQNSEVASTPKKQSHNSTTPWPYRALRRSALGPTLALLRNNGNDAGPVGEHASAEDSNTK